MLDVAKTGPAVFRICCDTQQPHFTQFRPQLAGEGVCAVCDIGERRYFLICELFDSEAKLSLLRGEHECVVELKLGGEGAGERGCCCCGCCSSDCSSEEHNL